MWKGNGNRLLLHYYFTPREKRTSEHRGDGINTFKYHVLCTDGKISLELVYYFTYFSAVIPSNICVYLSFRPFVVNTTEETSTPTRPVENVLTTKGRQERNTQVLDGTTVEK
jgi:hypothetical protein